MVLGRGGNGELGDNSIVSKRTPVSILGTKKTFCKIGNGYTHRLAIDYKGQIWSWGENNYGQLGNNSITNMCTPVSILGNKKTFCDLAAGLRTSFAIDYIGQIWSWGYSHKGQLGNNSVISERTPVKVCNI